MENVNSIANYYDMLMISAKDNLGLGEFHIEPFIAVLESIDLFDSLLSANKTTTKITAYVSDFDSGELSKIDQEIGSIGANRSVDLSLGPSSPKNSKILIDLTQRNLLWSLTFSIVEKN